MIVYIIHFSKPVAHARHYIGTTRKYKSRMEAHRRSKGAKILKRANELGINWRVVVKLYGSHKLERKLKSRHDTASLCPVCKVRRSKQNARTAKLRRAKALSLKQTWNPRSH